MSYSGGAYAGTPYGGMAGAGALATAADSWTISESIYSLVSKNAPDFWSWSDAATRAVTLSHGSADSFTITDVTTRIVGRTVYDSWPVSDQASPTVGSVRFSTDSFAIVSDIGRRFQAQWVDLPALLAIDASANQLAAQPGGTLALQAGGTLQLKADLTTLVIKTDADAVTLEDEPERVLIDG